MDNKDIYIFGAGTYGEAMFELAVACGYHPKGFYDDDESKKGNIVMDIPVLGKLDTGSESVKNKNFIIAIGNNQIRKAKMEHLISENANLPTLIHPTAILSPTVVVSKLGCYVHANSYLWTKVHVNAFSIVSPAVIVAHHTVLEKATFVSAGSNVGAGITIRENAFIGIGSTIMTGISYIGKNTTIGAGSVVISDIQDNVVVVGNPAKIIKYKQ